MDVLLKMSGPGRPAGARSIEASLWLDKASTDAGALFLDVHSPRLRAYGRRHGI